MRAGSAPAVIASEAKQSIARRKERMDCFVASAPRNDVEKSVALVVKPGHDGNNYCSAIPVVFTTVVSLS
jgi:hypothetical protein